MQDMDIMTMQQLLENKGVSLKTGRNATKIRYLAKGVDTLIEGRNDHHAWFSASEVHGCVKSQYRQNSTSYGHILTRWSHQGLLRIKDDGKTRYYQKVIR